MKTTAAASKFAKDMTAADLARLGFAPDRSWERAARERATGTPRRWYVKGCVRVVLGYEDSEAGNVGVFGFDETYKRGVEAVSHGILAWQMTFDGSTPAAVVAAALAQAVAS